MLVGTNSKTAKEHVGQRPTQWQEHRISFQRAKKRQNKRNQGENKDRKGCCAHGSSVNRNVATHFKHQTYRETLKLSRKCSPRATGDELALLSVQWLSSSSGLVLYKAREPDAYFNIVSGIHELVWDQLSNDYRDDH